MENERKEIRALSERYPKLQTLISYVNPETLRAEHKKQLKNKAVGVDEVTKQEYEENLTENINNLIKRMKSFSYRPKPVKRTYIPKSNGKFRPLGIPCYEDKLVQGCMAHVMKEIYEPKFLSCSYGFREKRSAHDAIRAINKAMITKKIGYVLDCDITGFFDNVDQSWLIKFLRHDIGDEKFIRYIVRFLKAGIMEDGRLIESDVGTPQGGLISPILANVYLHYVLDLWFEIKIKKSLNGDAVLVRYADDFLIMFQYKSEAERVYQLLKERVAKFNLTLSEEKTKIIEFGRFSRTKDTFDFLGFTHYNDKTRNNKYKVGHKISRKKMKEKRRKIKEWLMKNKTNKIPEIMKKLNIKLMGTYRYYGINGMTQELNKIGWYAGRITYSCLNRRSQRKSVTARKFAMIWKKYIKPPKIYVNIWN